MLSYQIFNSVHEYEKKISSLFIFFYSRFNALILPHPFFCWWTHDMKFFLSHIFPSVLTAPTVDRKMRIWNFYIFLHPWQSLLMNPINVHNEPQCIVWVKRSHLCTFFCVIIIEKKIVFQNNNQLLNINARKTWWVGRKDAFYTHGMNATTILKFSSILARRETILHAINKLVAF